jgi:sensor histidine kinase YesM
MRTKILVLCLSCTLLALALQTWFFLTTASSMIFRLEQEASEKALGRMQDDLYSWIKGYENALISIYNQPDLMPNLASGATVAYRMMQTAFEPDQYVNALYLYTLDHRIISYSRIASTPRFSFPEDIFQDPVASRSDVVADYVASDHRVMLVTSFYSPSRQKTILRLVLKLYTSNVQAKIGFLVCDVDPKGIQRIVEKYAYSDRQLVWLQPQGDEPVLVYGNPDGPAGAEYRRVSAAIRTGQWHNPGMRVGNNVFLATPQQKYDLMAYTLVPQELLEESQNLLLRNLILTALLVVLVALLSVTLVSRSLTTPLTIMMARLGQIQDGQTSLRLEVERRDEIGVLGLSINQMLDRIQDLIAAEYDVELQLKHAEYKALQAQVNPHFLYNTLDTMAGIAMTENGSLVASLCLAMSQLFRYSLDMKDPLATLGNELVHLKNYLHVMNVRTGNTLQVDLDVPDDLLDVGLPRLALQPLVENCIHHGLKNKRGKKRIRIGAVASGETVVVEVEDNGVGMDADGVNRQLEATPQGVTEKNASIGIGNIHARITLFFGPAYGVRVFSTPGEGTRVQISVPRNPVKRVLV